MAIKIWTLKENMDEAKRIFAEVVDTPCAQRIHFEFDMGIGAVPTVKYSIERTSVPKGDANEPHSR